MADQQQPAAGEAVYHEVSPAIQKVVKGMGAATALMVVLSFIFCIVQGTKDSTLYLLACNTVISAFVGIVNAWWYRQGDLSSEKYSFIVLLCVVILFQCFTTDIFVFNIPEYSAPPTTTASPNVTTTVKMFL